MDGLNKRRAPSAPFEREFIVSANTANCRQTNISTSNRYYPRHFVIITRALRCWTNCSLSNKPCVREQINTYVQQTFQKPLWHIWTANRVRYNRLRRWQCTRDCHLGMSRSYDCCYHRHFVTSLANVTLAVRCCLTWCQQGRLLTNTSSKLKILWSCPSTKVFVV